MNVFDYTTDLVSFSHDGKNGKYRANENNLEQTFYRCFIRIFLPVHERHSFFSVSAFPPTVQSFNESDRLNNGSS